MTSPRPGVLARLALLALALAAGCGSAVASASAPASGPSVSPAAPAPSAGTSASPASGATLGPSPSSTGPAPSPGPSPTATPSCAARTLAAMTEAQRIGQLFLVGLADDRVGPAERAGIASEHLGSVWFTTHTSAGVAGVHAVADAVQALATRPATAGVRFFVAANQEGGLIQALAGSGFDAIPSAVTQGTWSTATLRSRATTWGRELRSAGVNLDFAPVADVVPAGTESQNAPIGQLHREYGSDPATVAGHVAAFIAGMRAAGVATTVKHYPGLGRVEGNTDDTADVTDAVTTRGDPYLAPFRRGIGAGAPFVMVSLATYERLDPDRLAVFSPAITGDILRGDLGFGGVVMSDSLSATAVAAIAPGTRAIDFLAAGGDLVVVKPVDVAVAMANAVAGRAATSASFRRRVDDAALRVLEAKDAAGLLPCS